MPFWIKSHKFHVIFFLLGSCCYAKAASSCGTLCNKVNSWHFSSFPLKLSGFLACSPRPSTKWTGPVGSKTLIRPPKGRVQQKAAERLLASFINKSATSSVTKLFRKHPGRAEHPLGLSLWGETSGIPLETAQGWSDWWRNEALHCTRYHCKLLAFRAQQNPWICFLLCYRDIIKTDWRMPSGCFLTCFLDLKRVIGINGQHLYWFEDLQICISQLWNTSAWNFWLIFWKATSDQYSPYLNSLVHLQLIYATTSILSKMACMRPGHFTSTDTCRNLSSQA